MVRIGPREDAETSDRYDRRRFLAGAGSVALAGLLGSSGVHAASSSGPWPEADEYIVGFSPSVTDVTETARTAVPDAVDVRHSNETIGYATVSVPSASNSAHEQHLETITAADIVEYVEPNGQLHASVAPNDPSYHDQRTPQQVGCEAAWETTLGSADISIAVIDQGVQYDHPNLEAAAVESGANFVGADDDPYPAGTDERHGTHVAGIAAGQTNNGVGTAGISNCSLLAARALGTSGGGSLSNIVDSIQWAADAGAEIINISFGAPRHYDTLATACEYAIEEGALLIAAAGNDGSSSVEFPAAYPDVIAVAALDGERVASFSNVGSRIDIAAPGTNVLSTVPWDGYERVSGTSMAAPVVAGVAGLALSTYPDLEPLELRDHLLATATDLGLGETQQGAGRVDAAAAVGTVPDGHEETPETCGDETVTARATGDLSGGWWGESDRYMYTPRTDDPCSATISLEGPTGADFDLYLNADGESPTRWSHAEASAGSEATEEIELELSSEEDLRLQVHANSGSGAYTLQVEELGR